MMDAIRALLIDQINELDTLIIQQLQSRVDLVENIGQHIIDAGGKRLRPLLALLSYQALKQNDNHQQAVEFAATIEFIHTATLLHDDVVDISSLRRGKPTANAAFGNAPSVLVGDFIYSRAFQILVKIGNMDVMRLMSDTTNQIAEGEVLQLTKAGDSSTTEAEYLRVITDKTAILFAASLEGAAFLANADTNTRLQLHDYGLYLGIAFQVADDILDYQGDATVMGKNVGDDLNEGKPTLPLIYTIEHGSDEQVKLVKSAIENKSSEHIESIIQIINENGALDYCSRFALNYADKAKSCLEVLAPSAYKDALVQLADLAVHRVK